jgi:hypothetical protein
MEMTGKVWMLTAGLALASACGDDDGAVELTTRDSGATAVPVADTKPDAGSIDSGSGGGNIDATLPGEALAPDAKIAGDSAVVAPSPEAGAASIEVLGSWFTQFGFVEAITTTTWGEATLVEFDNSARVAITQDLPTLGVPGKFNKNIWTPIVNRSFYYCTVEFGLATVELARASTATADASDPDNGGCGGTFPWTKMSPPIEIAGKWLRDGAPVSIDSKALGDLTIESYDNDANSAVISETVAGSPPKYSKLRWTQPSASSLYTCYVARGFNTEGQVADDTTPADATQLTTGCLGKAWTAYTLAP